MRQVSFFGDSISTYPGYNPEGYIVYYQPDMQEKNGLESVNDTWWTKVTQALRASLCVNNSYSGSRVAGHAFPAASCDERTGMLHTEMHTPDLILIYIGYNDFGFGLPIRATGVPCDAPKNPTYFVDAYSLMLSQIKQNYPNAKIVCATLARSFVANHDWTFRERYTGGYFDEYNCAIREVCQKEGCYLADIAALDIRYETHDGAHPTKNGHDALYRAWVHCLTELGLL